MLLKSLLLYLFIFINLYPQKLSIIESTNDRVKVSIDFTNSYTIRDTILQNSKFQYITNTGTINKKGIPVLPEFIFKIGIPQNSKVSLQILSRETETYHSKFILPNTDSSKLIFSKGIYSLDGYYPNSVCGINKIYTFRYLKMASVYVNPYQFNPVIKELLFTKKIVLQVSFSGSDISAGYIEDKLTEEYIKKNIVNYNQAVNWTDSKLSLSKPVNYWIEPNKEYFKIYLREKGVYRITFRQLVNANPSISNGIDSRLITIFNDGQQVPIEIIDGGDGVFNNDDYLQFVGYSPSPTPYCKQNIYSIENIYWLSYQVNNPQQLYRNVDGFPKNWDYDSQTSTVLLHFERDSLYERLGYAPDDKRDYWFWAKISGSNGTPEDVFNLRFGGLPDFYDQSKSIKLKINMHGITDYPCIPDHRVSISLNNNLIGNAEWDGQNSYEFDKDITTDSSHLTSGTNYLTISAGGDICSDFKYDESRLNWVEIEYQRYNRTNSTNYIFSSNEGQSGIIRYWVWQWLRNNMKIYIPGEGKVISNVQFLNDTDKTVLFVDTVSGSKDYFCVSDDYFLSPDSISRTISSNLRDGNNAADYIIITHPKFRDAANKLAQFRSSNLTGYTNPKVMVADIQSIYDEFSFGLLDPYAIKSFLKYTFSNWKQPAPSYVVLIGDMSYDYRELNKTSRKNYIPSIPYQVQNYGQAVSDNMYAAVSGNDSIPDLSIGRLSCETTDEAEAIVDKIINYPADKSKAWKDKILLIAAGRDTADERRYGFNEESILLENNFISPQGYLTQKIFRFPDAANLHFIGSRQEIHNTMNSGVVFANFYGHGGGYQWDDVFYNEDILQLQNNNKLPFISSITCYTAHFDNQDVFGEKFLKIAGKGCIGFWGSSAITLFTPGVQLNKALCNQLFTNNIHTIGKAILFADNDFPINDQYDEDMLAVSTYLGDPALTITLPEKPDFSIDPASIILSPENPGVHDTVSIKVKIVNFGKIFTDANLSVLVNAEYNDTTETIASLKIPGFAGIDSIQTIWIPQKEGNVNLSVSLNGGHVIDENDYSDNSAIKQVYVYNISEPSVIKPINGFCTSSKQIEFLIADPGSKINRVFTYDIQIDTTFNFVHPVLEHVPIPVKQGMAKWITQELPKGIYFWRVRVKGNDLTGNWSPVYTFSIQDTIKTGYYVHDSQLKLFNLENVRFADSLNALVPVDKLLPPKPSNQNLLYDIQISLPDSLKGITTITTDGTFVYCAHISYYSSGSKIYKFGSGFNGTEKGKYYGQVSNYTFQVKHQMFYHSDGFIYIAFGDAHKLLKLNPATGDTTSVFINSGLLNSSDSRVINGAYYLTSDGRYVYNAAFGDSMGNHSYKIRILDPSNNWKLVKDIIPQSSSYPGFTGFFISGNYFFPYENNISGYMRRINLASGNFEDEWLTSVPFQPYYTWCYDWKNNIVYSSVFRENYKPKLSIFKGNYRSSEGNITTQEVGPALRWNVLNYNFEQTTNVGFLGNLQGFNRKTNKWENLMGLARQKDLSSINSLKYPKLRAIFSFSDTTTQVQQFAFKSFNIDYQPPPEISIPDEDVILQPDSILQGEILNLRGFVTNIGYSNADSVNISVLLNENNPVFNKIVSIKQDSSIVVDLKVKTDNLLGLNKIKVKASIAAKEFADFNNEVNRTFIVQKDMEKPVLKITFDGVEIVDGDYISTHPEVNIILTDNRPFTSGDTSAYKIYCDGRTLSFPKDSLTSIYEGATIIVKWYPQFKSGIHKVKIFAEDASGNLSDSSGYQVSFIVDDNNNILNVLNYPNPFKNETNFTFSLTGSELPEEITVRIFTVAGRLIRVLNIPRSVLKFGFNKIYYDGKDQDGNSLANGVYFFKVSVKERNKFISVINKFAKIR